jgi:hypothetical protein
MAGNRFIPRRVAPLIAFVLAAEDHRFTIIGVTPASRSTVTIQ